MRSLFLTLEIQAQDLLIDERLGRRKASRLGVPIIEIFGILVLAKQRKLISDVQSIMDSLIEKLASE